MIFTQQKLRTSPNSKLVVKYSPSAPKLKATAMKQPWLTAGRNITFDAEKQADHLNQK